MAKFLRQNKVVVILSGRHAGKKAVIVKNTYRTIPDLGLWRAGRIPFGWMDDPLVEMIPSFKHTYPPHPKFSILFSTVI